MIYPTTPTSAEEHRRRNDHQLLVFARTRRDLFRRLTAGLTADSLAHLRRRLLRMLVEEAGPTVVERDGAGLVQLADGSIWDATGAMVVPPTAYNDEALRRSVREREVGR